MDEITRIPTERPTYRELKDCDLRGGEERTMSKWEVMRNTSCYQVWRQTRTLWPGEPMHSGVREMRGCFHTEAEAQAYADQLNREEAGTDGELSLIHI